MKRRLAAAALAVLVAACSTPPLHRPKHLWSGRLSLQVDSDPPQSFHAGFELQGSPQEGELTLFSPIGTEIARLSWNPRQATLERGSERWQQPSVDLLTRQLVQAPVPVAALFDWVQGRPSGAAGWHADLSGHAQGRIRANRQTPLPRAELRLVLEP
jgi:outer membrane lipoprotein LolB